MNAEATAGAGRRLSRARVGVRLVEREGATVASTSCLDCMATVPKGRSRCQRCERAHDKARGTRQERGYDAAFDAAGREFQRRMDAGERFRCWRPSCGKPLGTRRGVDWTLGHDDHDRSVIRGPECPACQYATSGRRTSPRA